MRVLDRMTTGAVVVMLFLALGVAAGSLPSLLGVAASLPTSVDEPVIRWTGTTPTRTGTPAAGAVCHYAWTAPRRMIRVSNYTGATIKVLIDGDATTPAAANRWDKVVLNGEEWECFVRVSKISVLFGGGGTGYAEATDFTIKGWREVQ